MARSAKYQPSGPILLRASTDPGNLELPGQLDLWRPGLAEEGIAWLSQIWAQPQIREAMTLASPSLAATISQLTNGRCRPAETRELRGAVRSAAFYLARWQRRATPFGLFAGITTAEPGTRAAVRIGAEHQVTLRDDAEWLAAVIGQLERHRLLRDRLLVRADNAGYVRDGRLIVALRPAPGVADGSSREISIPFTRPVAAVFELAGEPIRFGDLAARLHARYPAISLNKVSSLLHELFDQGVLVSSLRPPATATDGLAHLISALGSAAARDFTDLSGLLDRLDEVAMTLRRHNASANLSPKAALRARAVSAMRSVTGAGPGHVLMADVKLDAQVTIPQTVIGEAAGAADLLVRLTTRPFGTAAWLDYHARFRARHGPGALVPVRDLVSDSGLGYPAGYLGTAAARPAWRMLTDRDAALLALIYKAAADRQDEIVLTEPDIEALTTGDHSEVVVPQRIELGFEIHASTVQALDRGDFELWVTAAPRPHTSMADRFAYLLDDNQRAALAATFAAGEPDTIAAQLSFPPRRIRNDNVTRVPGLLPHVVAISEHPSPDVTLVGVDDLAVTADGAHLHLVHRPTGKRVMARAMHALDTHVQTPPLARFLAEIGDARAAVFGPFDFGAARTLPHTPRLRYRRVVLAPARWTLRTADLQSEHRSSWPDALRAWADRWHVPSRLVLCQEELRLPLDLDCRLDTELLRHRLRQAGRVDLKEAGRPDAAGWIGRPAELLVTLTRRQSPARRLPPIVPPAAAINPGSGEVLKAELAGNPARFPDILTGHLPQFTADLAGIVITWWITRHRDLIHPEADQLAIVLRLREADHYADVAACLARWTSKLQGRGLIARLTLTGYQPQPGRYGHGPAMLAAERVFLADTKAAIAQIELAATIPGLAQPLTAASLTVLATAFGDGAQDLVRVLKQETGPLDRGLRDRAIALADPAGDLSALCQLPGGAKVAVAWRERGQALAAYYQALSQQREPVTVLRTLLHDHHGRALGIDPDVERVTNRLARAVALRQLAMTANPGHARR